LAAALVLQRWREQEARHHRPASDETRACPPAIDGEPHCAEHDEINARPAAALCELSEASGTRADRDMALERAAALDRAERLNSPLEKHGDQKRSPRASSFTFPKTEKVLGWRHARLSRRIASGFRSAQSHKLALPGEYLRQAQSTWLSAFRSARQELRGGTDAILSGLPKRALGRRLRHTPLSLLKVADGAKNMASFVRYGVKAWVTYDFKFTLRLRRAVTKAATPLLVLLIIVAFTLTRVWPRGHLLTVAAVSRMNHPSGKDTVRKAVELRPTPLDQVSHMQVTDRVVLSVVESLSRYEIPGLRRQAAYGDESAAFIMGMLYETGHLVPQSCTKAAAWVTASASAGSAAAQYNLGLRYRDGDGLPADEDEAEKWLRKAAHRQYSKATSALQRPPAMSP